ncbi:hypothetical protein BJY00DRAFT_287254 [Aspergillus carlsbadensis]|nr:hypothetical protein BJY00DRAFT_287254 [Aspergillus carlsbadensis]
MICWPMKTGLCWTRSTFNTAQDFELEYLVSSECISSPVGRRADLILNLVSIDHTHNIPHDTLFFASMAVCTQLC